MRERGKDGRFRRARYRPGRLLRERARRSNLPSPEMGSGHCSQCGEWAHVLFLAGPLGPEQRWLWVCGACAENVVVVL